MHKLPNPQAVYPRSNDKNTCYLKSIIKNPNIIVGDYTYYHDFVNPLNFESNLLYHYPFCNHDKLIIGKFCSIAHGAKFLFNGGNHNLNALSSYPFPVLAEDWGLDVPITDAWHNKGDIVIGNDVWLGYDCVIMSGVKIGDGAIIATRALVTKDVEPYSIVGGSPAKQIKKRFDQDTVDFLLKLKWWDLPSAEIQTLLPYIMKGDIAKLREIKG